MAIRNPSLQFPLKEIAICPTGKAAHHACNGRATGGAAHVVISNDAYYYNNDRNRKPTTAAVYFDNLSSYLAQPSSY